MTEGDRLDTKVVPQAEGLVGGIRQVDMVKLIVP